MRVSLSKIKSEVRLNPITATLISKSPSTWFAALTISSSEDSFQAISLSAQNTRQLQQFIQRCHSPRGVIERLEKSCRTFSDSDKAILGSRTSRCGCPNSNVKQLVPPVIDSE